MARLWAQPPPCRQRPDWFEEHQSPLRDELRGVSDLAAVRQVSILCAVMR
jgi:hypothetical protein